MRKVGTEKSVSFFRKVTLQEECNMPACAGNLEDVGTRNSGTMFLGVDGATSLKAELVGRVPMLNTAAHYRDARQLVKSLGGVGIVRSELVYAGFVDPFTGLLTTGMRPRNIFARLAANVETQIERECEQAALGEFKDRFLIAANLQANDRYWDTTDPEMVKQVSMSERHRLLTTKCLHWQWFNPLVFGMVDETDGGWSVREALGEVEKMKAAAMLYAKNVGGWSDQVGLYVTVFGHNTVNSLFVHVLDLSCTGPAFSYQAYKSLPLDECIRVLREETLSTLIPGSLGPQEFFGRGKSKGLTLLAQNDATATPVFLQSTFGTTSVKDEIVMRLPIIRDAASFRAARRLLKDELGGIAVLREELVRAGFIDKDTNLLTTSTSPFNVFARLAGGVMTQPGLEEEQTYLGDFADEFMICRNRPDNDDHWDSEDPAWASKASMSERHRFLVVKDLHWQWFNALVFGLVPPEEGGWGMEETVEMVVKMKAAALHYVSRAPSWSDKPGLFFHVFGHNSVNSMHVHILDMDKVGPAFWFFEYKNCPIDAIIRVLKEEMEALRSNSLRSAFEEASRAAALAANAASEIVDLLSPRTSTQLPTYAGLTGTKRQVLVRDDREEILVLNVGGSQVSAPRSTFLIAPPKSALHELFADGSACDAVLDEHGVRYLDFPGPAFIHVVNHLRLLRLTPPDHVVEPRFVPEEDRQEVEHLAWLLGVWGLLFCRQSGRANKSCVTVQVPLPPRPRWRQGCCSGLDTIFARRAKRNNFIVEQPMPT